MKCAECSYNGNCKEKSERPDLCGCTSGIPIEKMDIKTNEDRIRAMTNQELAEFLLIFDDATDKYNYILQVIRSFSIYDSCDSKEEAKKKQLEWLESEVDNG